MSTSESRSVIGGCACGGSSREPNFDCERCRLVWFVLQVKELRAAQTDYFKSRSGVALDKSVRLERRIDKAVERLTATQPELFDNEFEPS